MVNLCVQVRRSDGSLIYIPADIYSIQPESGSFIVDDARQAWKDLGAKVIYSPTKTTGGARRGGKSDALREFAEEMSRIDRSNFLRSKFGI